MAINETSLINYNNVHPTQWHWLLGFNFNELYDGPRVWFRTVQLEIVQ